MLYFIVKQIRSVFIFTLSIDTSLCSWYRWHEHWL